MSHASRTASPSGAGSPSRSDIEVDPHSQGALDEVAATEQYIVLRDVSLAWLCVGAGPLLHTIHTGGEDRAGWLLVLTIVLAFATAMQRGARPPRARMARGTTQLAACVIGAAATDAGVGAWMALGAATATLGVVSAPRHESSDALTSAAGPAIGLSLLAARLGWSESVTAALVVAAIATAAAAYLWAKPAIARRLARVVVDLARLLGRGLALVLFAALSIPAVLTPWAFQTISRWDPLWTPRRRGSEWLAAASTPRRVGRPWEADTTNRFEGRWRRGHRRLRWLAVAAVAAYGGLLVARSAVLAGPEVLEAPAMADSPFWPDLSHAQEVLAWHTEMRGYDVSALPESLRSEHLNIAQRRRVSWEPPAGRCPTTTVWMFGGSTTFGYAQRDDRTIASQISRMAWAERRAVRVLNWGVPGDTHWIEARRLEAALLGSRDRPELVVFYDGVNDYGAQAGLAAAGRTGDPLFATFEDSGLFPNIKKIWAPINALFVRAGDVSVPRPRTRDSSPEAVVAATARQYALSVSASRDVLDRHGIRGVYFYQPWRATRDRPVAAETSGDLRVDVFDQGQVSALWSRLPADVVDLGAVMDATREPVYYDGIHTNELGAEIVARAILDELRPLLGPPCNQP